MTIQEILEYNFLNIGDFHLNLSHLLAAIVVLIAARVLAWSFSRIISQFFRRRKLDLGRQYAFVQFVKYIIYTTAFVMALESVGIQLSVLWGGAAALLVGIGLGLQQTFNDLISGLILLIEGSVEVGDIVEVNGVVGQVIQIGIRTSKIETRDKISILIPNSKLVGDNATNWSHNDEPTRFFVNVGVAYGSDIELVMRLLLQVAAEHESVLDTPVPRVQFRDFGSSALDFTLYFFSEDFFPVEFVKSDLRCRITHLFAEHDIQIPFPQRDVWLRSAD